MKKDETNWFEQDLPEQFDHDIYADQLDFLKDRLALAKGSLGSVTFISLLLIASFCFLLKTFPSTLGGGLLIAGSVACGIIYSFFRDYQRVKAKYESSIFFSDRDAFNPLLKSVRLLKSAVITDKENK